MIWNFRRSVQEPDLSLMLKRAVYALDSATIDLCLSMFEWAAFRRTRVAVKRRTVLDLHGSIPTFIHISDGKLHDVHALDLVDPEASASHVMGSGYVDFKCLDSFVGSYHAGVCRPTMSAPTTGIG